MLSKKIKDLKLRLLYTKTEKKKIILKYLFIKFLNKYSKNKKLKKKKLIFLFLFFRLRKLSTLNFKIKTKIVRRCAISSRGRGNFRIYNISRFFLREFIQFGFLPGYKKAV